MKGRKKGSSVARAVTLFMEGQRMMAIFVQGKKKNREKFLSVLLRPKSKLIIDSKAVG